MGRTVAELMSGNISNAITNAKTWGGVIRNIKSYGAEGDGTIDDTSKIALAVAAAYAETGIVYFPPGTYLVTGNITNWHDVEKRGPGKIKYGSAIIPIEPDVTDSITLYVDGTNGSDTSIGYGTGSAAFKTVQAAVDSIPQYARGIWTINIAAGTYAETVTVQKMQGSQFTLYLTGKKDGSNVPTVIFDGGGIRSYGLQVIWGMRAILTDIKFQNYTYAGATFEYGTWANLSNVHAYNNANQQIRINHAVAQINDSVIEGNGQGYGIVVYHSFASIMGSTIDGCTYDGVLYSAASSGHFDNNVVQNCGNGLHAGQGSFPSSDSSTFKRCTIGIYSEHGSDVNLTNPVYGSGADANGTNLKRLVSFGYNGKMYDQDWRTILQVEDDALDVTTQAGTGFLFQARTNGFYIGGAWNGNHLIMGTYHFWVDSSGRLRSKNGAPTSDLDGTVVGTQT